MKYLLTLAMALCFSGYAFADQEAANTDKKTPEVKSLCPITKISDNDKCTNCHVLAMRDGKTVWTVKEVDPDEVYRYPHSNFKFVNGEAYYVCNEIDANTFEKIFSYLKRYPKIKTLTIELQTPGGSIMQMWRIVSQMDDFKANGGTIKCIVKGFCASAGFILLNNASPGQRFVAPNAEIMWHEVQSLEIIFGFKVSSPSDKEDEARILRHFQDNGNCFLASKGKMSKAEIDDRIRKREWWMTGQEAVKLGFADGIIK